MTMTTATATLATGHCFDLLLGVSYCSSETTRLIFVQILFFCFSFDFCSDSFDCTCSPPVMLPVPSPWVVKCLTRDMTNKLHMINRCSEKGNKRSNEPTNQRANVYDLIKACNDQSVLCCWRCSTFIIIAVIVIWKAANHSLQSYTIFCVSRIDVFAGWDWSDWKCWLNITKFVFPMGTNECI